MSTPSQTSAPTGPPTRPPTDPPATSNLPKPILWTLLSPLFRCSPTPVHQIRRVILRACGATIASTTKVRPSARITKPWNLSAGALTVIGDHAILDARHPITIGDRCVVSQLTQIRTAVIDPDQSPGAPDPARLREGPVTIEDDCWIATDTLVLPNTTVHAGTVVGARACIDADLPAWRIAVGDPAVPRGERAFVPAAT